MENGASEGGARMDQARMPEVGVAVLEAERRALNGEPAVSLDEARNRIARRIAAWEAEGSEPGGLAEPRDA